ncbi:hypothetical protein NQ318_014146 [Aromia moschata]|uniref:Uncharacterized protein n=1 Tax=Aromia moschata TaxID=1265417 RepID=A0AAV8X7N1_9CUCU|nr:hypothetical protein NQ318_014146 [Aromia moschata]
MVAGPPPTYKLLFTKRRLQSAVKQLEKNGLMSRYNAVFEEWKQLNIIEETIKVMLDIIYHITGCRGSTRVRPVFVPLLVKKRNHVNQCLEKGENLIELIPALLVRFREYEIGVISDIKQAFLQISVNPNSVLLGASIKYHLNKSMGNCLLPGCQYTKETIERLDPLTSLLKGDIDYGRSTIDLKVGVSDQTNSGLAFRLGLSGFRIEDILTINRTACDTESAVTKRNVVKAQKILPNPVTLLPKLWLGFVGKQNIRDTEVDGDVATQFRKGRKICRNFCR